MPYRKKKKITSYSYIALLMYKSDLGFTLLGETLGELNSVEPCQKDNSMCSESTSNR